MFLFDTKIVPLDPIHSQWAAHVFSEIEHEHKFGETFPAYSYVIECLLKTIGRGDLVMYIHPLKCRRRRAIYKGRYGKFFRHPPSVDTLASRGRSGRSVRYRDVEDYTEMVSVQSMRGPASLSSQQ